MPSAIGSLLGTAGGDALGLPYEGLSPCRARKILGEQDFCRAERLWRGGQRFCLTAAIVGGIVGAAIGREGIPERFLLTLFEWPRTVRCMERLGEVVERQSS